MLSQTPWRFVFKHASSTRADAVVVYLFYKIFIYFDYFYDYNTYHTKDVNN